MYQLEETGRQRLAVAGYFDQLAGQSERLEYLDELAEEAVPV
jgi:tRNA-dihydrouridine synthase B